MGGPRKNESVLIDEFFLFEIPVFCGNLLIRRSKIVSFIFFFWGVEIREVESSFLSNRLLVALFT